MIFEQKIIIDELEGSLAGAPIDTTNPEIPALAVEANPDENIIVGAKVSKINEFSNGMEINLE